MGALLEVCSGAGVLASIGLFEFALDAFEFDAFELTAELLPASPQAKERTEIINVASRIALLDLMRISLEKNTPNFYNVAHRPKAKV